MIECRAYPRVPVDMQVFLQHNKIEIAKAQCSICLPEDARHQHIVGSTAVQRENPHQSVRSGSPVTIVSAAVRWSEVGSLESNSSASRRSMSAACTDCCKLPPRTRLPELSADRFLIQRVQSRHDLSPLPSTQHLEGNPWRPSALNDVNNRPRRLGNGTLSHSSPTLTMDTSLPDSLEGDETQRRSKTVKPNSPGQIATFSYPQAQPQSPPNSSAGGMIQQQREAPVDAASFPRSGLQVDGILMWSRPNSGC